MYVKETKLKNGRINISIVEGRWENGRSRTRTVEGFGYLDALDSERGDGRAYVQGICDRLNAEKAAAQARVDITLYPDQRIDRRTVDVKNIGCAIPLNYYNALGIEHTLRNHIRNTKVVFDPNAVMRLLVVERIIAPSSKLAAWERRGSYFFKSDFSDDDVYRALDLFAECKDTLISTMNTQISKMHTRNLTDVYYDVTNYYFEIEAEDIFRRKGVSKEHRPDPIVQMGLMQDKDGIPLCFDTFAGNTSDCETMLPLMRRLKRDTGTSRMVMVADKGLNTSTNIAAVTLDGNGFVFSQSIRGKKSSTELRNWVVSESGYRMKGDDEGGTDFKLKSRQDAKTVHIKDDEGKMTDVDIDIKVVAFWSSKYDKRAKYERAKVIEKAQELVRSPSAYDKAIHYGAAKYVKNTHVDKNTGELLEDVGKQASLDTDLIAAEERLDGYYCIITSETGLDDESIIDIYRGLWRIEEAFKITKSYLSARPVFVWTKEHIEAHFLICYIALCIIRLIQYDTESAHSAEAIIDEIRQLNGVHLEDNWWRFYHRSDLSDELARAVGIDLTRKNMQLHEVKGILAQVKRKTDGRAARMAPASDASERR